MAFHVQSEEALALDQQPEPTSSQQQEVGATKAHESAEAGSVPDGAAVDGSESPPKKRNGRPPQKRKSTTADADFSPAAEPRSSLRRSGRASGSTADQQKSSAAAEEEAPSGSGAPSAGTEAAGPVPVEATDASAKTQLQASCSWTRFSPSGQKIV